MVMPPHRKSALEARYDKAWSAVGLGFSQLKQFIAAIKTGDLNTLKSILGKESLLTSEQKKALLTRSFNENDFNNTTGTCIKNAETLAKKFENPDVIAYISQQKNRFSSPLTQLSIHSSKHTQSEQEEKAPHIRPPSKS